MWVALMEDAPDDLSFRAPRTLQLNDLRHCARECFIEMVKSEVLVVLSNIPGKDVTNTYTTPPSANPNALVALFAAALDESREAVETQNPELVGRLAVVLEGRPE
eukprot:GHVO01053278.1.p1 GENE.GHVO01053278.1~~GHVO01053278.1.p1  ORF type:complete len:105 (+),score=4.42 GHVO01053278.1:409-723(+)